jgi:intein/homing endonuclease
MNSFKQQCIALRKKDKTIIEIMAITGRAKSSIYTHIKNIPLSQKKQEKISEQSRKQARANAGARKGKSLRPIKIFGAWTPELVLLVSHLMFDGEILKKKCYYNNRSKVLIERVENIMRQIYDFPPKIFIDKVSGVYKIRYYNVALGNFLYTKAIELQECILSLHKSEQREFVRAFFDDEGCMDYRPLRNLRQVRGYQDDREILKLMQRLLRNFDIDSKLQGVNEVVINGKENLKRFQ